MPPLNRSRFVGRGVELDSEIGRGNVEVAFGTFLQTDENVVGVVAASVGCSYTVPVERCSFGVAV